MNIGEGNGNPLQCSCLENPRDGGAWWAAVYGVAQSRIRLKQCSSSSYEYYKSLMQIYIYFSLLLCKYQRMELMGCRVDLCLILKRNWKIIHQSGFYFILSKSMYDSCKCSILCPIFSVVWCLFATLVVMKRYLFVVFILICILLITNDFECLSMISCAFSFSFEYLILEIACCNNLLK